MCPADCLFCGHCNPPASKYCNACGDALHLQPCEACGAVDGRTAVQCYRCGQPFAHKASRQAGIPTAAAPEPAHVPGGVPGPGGGADFWRNPRSKPAGAAAAVAARDQPGSTDPTSASPAVPATMAQQAPAGETGARRRLSPLLVAGLVALAGLGAYAFHRQTTARTAAAPVAPVAPATFGKPVAPAARPANPTRPAMSSAAEPAAPRSPGMRAALPAPIASAPPDDSNDSGPMPFGVASDPAARAPLDENEAPGRDVRPGAPDLPAAAVRSGAPHASRSRPSSARPASNAPPRKTASVRHRTDTPTGPAWVPPPVENTAEPVGHDTLPVRSPQPPAEVERVAPWVPPSLYQGRVGRPMMGSAAAGAAG